MRRHAKAAGAHTLTRVPAHACARAYARNYACVCELSGRYAVAVRVELNASINSSTVQALEHRERAREHAYVHISTLVNALRTHACMLESYMYTVYSSYTFYILYTLYLAAAGANSDGVFVDTESSFHNRRRRLPHPDALGCITRARTSAGASEMCFFAFL